MTENTQIIIRKNGVEIAVLNDAMKNIFRDTIHQIYEEEIKQSGFDVVFKKNKRFSFNPKEIFGFLHSVIYKMIQEESQNIFNLCMKNNTQDEHNEESVNEFIGYYGGLYYDISILENLLLSFIYSDRKGKKNEWTYCVEDTQVSFQDLLDELYENSEEEISTESEENSDDISE